MKSKIRVEYDFDKKEPYIQFYLEKETEEAPDLRDEMLKALIQEASYNPIWVQYPPHNTDNSVPQIRVQEPHTFVTSMEEWCVKKAREDSERAQKFSATPVLTVEEIVEFFGKMTRLLS